MLARENTFGRVEINSSSVEATVADVTQIGVYNIISMNTRDDITFVNLNDNKIITQGFISPFR